MKNVLVIYQSSYGSTKSYVDEMQKQLGADIVSYKDVKKADIESHQVIVIAGSVRISKLKIVKKLKKYLDLLNDKSLYLFAVGLMEDPKEALESLKKNNPILEDYEFEGIYYGPGKFDVEEMAWFHRKLFSFLGKSLKNKENLSDDDRQFLHAIEHGADHRDMSLVEPLVESIKKAS